MKSEQARARGRDGSRAFARCCAFGRHSSQCRQQSSHRAGKSSRGRDGSRAFARYGASGRHSSQCRQQSSHRAG
ncbi:MAG: hypothetical protein ACI4O7_11840, partial [Aristaeellaceae bacterium]